MERVGDMTREELRQLVEAMVEERIGPFLWTNGGRRWINKGGRIGRIRTWREISEAIDRIGWTPPPDAPTPLEMLREDRDR